MPETAKKLKAFIKLPFPHGGVYGRLAVDEQPSNYAIDAGNVWNYDSISGRERGGSRPGLEVVGSVGAPVRFLGHMNYVDTSVTPEQYKTALVASGAGGVYTSLDQGVTWTNRGSGAYSDRPISLACHLQKIYIPATASPWLKVYDPVAATYTDVSPGTGTTSYTTGTVDLANNSPTVTDHAASITWPSWAASGYFTVTDDSGNDGPIYTVASFSNTGTATLTLDVAWAQTSNYASATNKSYKLRFDANPAKCTLACTWHDCVILAGDRLNPHLFYGSRIGDGSDWRFGVTNDPASAFSSPSVPGAGAVGEQITALIPANDDQLYIGSTHSLSVMDGHPLNGGSLRYVDQNIGPLDQSSWCWIPHSRGNWLAMLTKQGLYVMPPDGKPIPVSREIIPAWLGGIDPSQAQCCLGYDMRYNGLVVSVNPINSTGSLSSTSTNGNYGQTRTFYNGGAPTVNTTTAQLFWAGMDSVQGEGGERDIVRPSFWPMSYGDGAQPYAAYNNPTYIEATGTEGSLFLGGKDGKIRRHKSSAGTDSDFGGSSNVSSFVVYGPFPLAEPGYEGILNSLDIVLAQSSGTPINFDVFTGYSAEEAYQAYLNLTPFKRDPSAVNYTAFSITEVGLSKKFRIRARGSHACLRFWAPSNVRWSIESCVAYFQQAGLRRRR